MTDGENQNENMESAADAPMKTTVNGEEYTFAQKDERAHETQNEKKKERRSDLFFYILCAVILMGSFGFRAYWTNTYCAVTVSGNSMNQTLLDGDKLLMTYYKGNVELHRGDIIVVDVSKHEECADFANPFLIKRLIATEGDKVKCIDGQVYVWYAGESEYQPLDEPYAYYTDKAGYDFSEYVVKEGQIFFLGDNRNNSCDSRYNEWSGSHIQDLYNVEDVYGVVTDWAYENREMLETFLFLSCAGNRKK